ncbi:MAG TPA: hypothetical protein VMT46_11930 [Anaerolineaceae bacterium]|nr:hypothetical protein [Anaerolineaceae bacterium]
MKQVRPLRNEEIRLVWDAATRREIEFILMTIPPLRPYRAAELWIKWGEE